MIDPLLFDCEVGRNSDALTTERLVRDIPGRTKQIFMNKECPLRLCVSKKIP